ncbi:MAG: Cdc6/Cdc18 family protein [Thermoprotei archaeon]|nr:orc1/cdc6 family replication initiation protein [TACK group archaeon]
MSRLDLSDIFESASRSKIFADRSLLRPDYVPLELPHREKMITSLGRILSPALVGDRPSNVFVYGLTGTGKTAVTRYVTSALADHASKMKTPVPVSVKYINTRENDTSYRVLAEMASGIGIRVPFTGLSVAEVRARLVGALRSITTIYVVVLDEIDAMISRIGDPFLYQITRMNEEIQPSQMSIIGITNDIRLADNLDPRVKSSLNDEQVFFPQYQANELQDILAERAKLAFLPGALEPDVIPFCAAIGAREHGDARRSLDLLRRAGEIAEIRGANRVQRQDVEEARAALENDTIIDSIKSLTLDSRVLLLVLANAKLRGKDKLTSGELYASYENIITNGLKDNALTERRLADLVKSLEMSNLITANLVSEGRGGRTKHISLQIDPSRVIQSLADDPRLGDLVGSVGRDVLAHHEDCGARRWIL